MNYPIWHLPASGGGLLIAIIAILHVVISHLAVGGGLFLVLTERKALKTNDQALLNYVQSHTWFFLLLTMVFGGVSGVGIWFIIALVGPGGTSVLIHNFVFAWAIEWVFFIAEIVALLIYHYRFGKMKSEDHVKIGWLYFIFAWLSLFVINGILAFMLTPGKWIETGNFWNGFFNPGFIPSLLFRTSIAFVFAGVFGLITAVFLKDSELRNRIFRYCAKWMYYPLLVLFITGIYYTKVIAPEAFENLFHFNPESKFFINALILSSFGLFGLGLFTLFRLPSSIQKLVTFFLVIISFTWMGGFEYMREIARKPYVIYETMYSNGISPADVEIINENGFLKVAKWAEIDEVTEENQLEAGREIFRLQCMSCHSISGRNAIKPLINNFTKRGIEAQLTGMGKVNTYMPPFAGTEIEKKALAAYLYEDLLGKETMVNPDYLAEQYPLEVPAFNSADDDYVLLVWNDLGMHCISDNEKYFTFLPPANTFNAQLFKRGDKPELVTNDAIITYEIESGNENPEERSMFWKYSKATFGVDIPLGKGLKGKSMNDSMDLHGNHFAAELIPVLPYRSDQKFNPYPMFTFKAFDKSTGRLLVETKAVAPVSTEMGCRNCHGGGWAWNNISGVADETAENILAAHDKYNNTTLLADAKAGNPKLCQSCHADPAVGAPGKPDVLNFSAAVHGFHANYMSDMYEEACNLCHPSHPEGNTTCYRGRHYNSGLTCTDCHGRIEDHALGLLAGQTGKPSADRLSASLEPKWLSDKSTIIPRTPWIHEPDCKSCHTNFNMMEDGFSGSAFNLWVEGFSELYRNRTDEQGVMCISCHGSTHAVYGAENKYGKQRDNMQPLQYQGMAGTIGTHDNCQVCHKKKMNTNGHHRNQVLREYDVAIVE
ncbi:MAG: cytochrome ubiquinol oxidase subunit I [Bacteroidales bacterium]|nr:cytochrome ubiquinol oxidase subunit I [Bacteroidales bacterium]MCF8391233.1 cytochrome ubiquinol oxidase subunit I [Bacteroidales bacterium]